MRSFLWCLLCAWPYLASASALNYRAIAFYYDWYGSVAVDGQPYHWEHDVMRENAADRTHARISGLGNIASDFYPQLGAYSSADPAVVEQHMQWIAEAGIGVVAVTWLGPGDPSAKAVPLLLDAAERHAVKICFQIEPVARKTAGDAREAIRYLIETFGAHPAFYREPQTRLPLFFIYDSYVIDVDAWKDVLTAGGSHSIRRTAYDALVLGLWLKENEQAFFETAGFDGFYTYFASAGFTYGSTPQHWPELQRWAAGHGKIFVPSVGPGYIDTRVRPWNAKNTKARDAGKYYDAMFAAAIASKAPFIGITSFNEWHEATQIEPTAPYTSPVFAYQDYRPRAPDYYLKRTAMWLQRFAEQR